MHGYACWALLISAIGLHAAAVTAAAASEVPDVSNCNLCMDCRVGPSSHQGVQQSQTQNALALQQQQISANVAEVLSFFKISADNIADELLEESKLLLSLRPPEDALTKQALPNCTQCTGCNTLLTNMSSSSQFMGITYEHERGASTAWLFKSVGFSPKEPDAQAVVKMYCVPLAKSDKPYARFSRCKDSRVVRVVTMLLALQKLSEECGFTDIVTKVWVDKVNAVVPGVGYHIRWHGLWMEQAPGISLENLIRKGKPHRLGAHALLDILHNRLNGTQVLKAAIFDLLTSQCDRHAQNIFIDEQGQIKLIDNEVALQNSWLHCGFDSMLLPNTLKRNVIIYNTWRESAWSNPLKLTSPQLLLDYRCYLPDGKAELGTDYPPQIKQCLSKISSMTVQQVQEHYDIPQLPALNLHTRAKDMLTKGFEWAMVHGAPRNGPHQEYKVQPKCCRIKWVPRIFRFQCAHEWDVHNYATKNLT